MRMHICRCRATYTSLRTCRCIYMLSHTDTPLPSPSTVGLNTMTTPKGGLPQQSGHLVWFVLVSARICVYA